jgi:adenylate cyclase class 2
MEIERRYKCENPKQIKAKLVALGFSKITEEEQIDLPISQVYPTLIHAWPRIRYYPQKGIVIITIKGKRFDEQLGPVRIESEIQTTDFNKSRELFKALGFYEMGQVEKRRTIYEKDFIEISIDQVKDLGDFIEIEVKHEDTKLALDTIDKLASLMNLKEESKGGYFDCINKEICEDFNKTYANLLEYGMTEQPASKFQVIDGRILKVFSDKAAYYGGFPAKRIVVEEKQIILKNIN